MYEPTNDEIFEELVKMGWNWYQTAPEEVQWAKSSNDGKTFIAWWADLQWQEDWNTAFDRLVKRNTDVKIA